ncbi:MAG: hypothetical protein NT120_01660 [Candidatus Aenigmarchaeota archaeon]|nr:hypothetical protein [Candidatus Aenigmarchaeota archaeon]
MKIFFEMDTEKDNADKKMEELKNIEKIVAYNIADRAAPPEYLMGLTSRDMAF